LIGVPPLALLERTAGDLDVLALNRLAHLIDRQASCAQLLDVDDDVDLAGAAAVHRDVADPVHRLEGALDLFVRDLGQYPQAR
jgi:hypothetical protein